jgi:uncharacterized protein (DUF433 family)
MSREYVQARGGNLYVGPSRVTLDSIIIPWQMGQSLEDIQRDFPSIPLASVYGAVAYYLEHRVELDQWLREGEERYVAQRNAARAANPEFYAHMRRRLASAAEQVSHDAPSLEDTEGATEAPVRRSPRA